jgi:tetratricopeptide (TPR) repeat protein
MSFVTSVIVVAVLIAGAWWLSGYDSRVTGENKMEDFVRRVIRCAITALLVLVATLNPYFAIFMFVALAILWASCVAEFFTHRIHNIVDPHDDRKFDPKEVERELDKLGQLVRHGRNAEVLELCKKMEESGEASHLAIEATLHRAYKETVDSIDASPLLGDVRRLNEQGKFVAAESRLKQMLATQPANWAAMLLLMRIYVKDLAQPDKALAYLHPDDNQRHLPEAFRDYARRSIAQWADEAANHQGDGQRDAVAQVKAGASEPEVSVDELLRSNQLATAVERLEKELSEQPKNFDRWLKLAEAYAVYCADLNRAGKIIQKMENTMAFTAEEIQRAKSQLRDWQKARRS